MNSIVVSSLKISLYILPKKNFDVINHPFLLPYLDCPSAEGFSPRIGQEFTYILIYSYIRIRFRIHSYDYGKSESYGIFKKSLLKFIRTTPNSVFNVVDSYGIKVLTRLRVGWSHLREHKFRRNFQNTVNLLYSCSLEIEMTFHFFLRCQHFITLRNNLMNELQKLDFNISNLDEAPLNKLLLLSDPKYENKANKKIRFILSTEQFDDQLMRRYS